MTIGGLIPGSDSGKAEEAWALRICFSFDRGFLPALGGRKKNHLQESRAFWILFCGKKVSGKIKFRGQPNLVTAILKESELRMWIEEKN